MDHVTLQVAKRAMPGSGRVRVNARLLDDLSVVDQSEIVVTTAEGKSHSFTLFADTLVEEGRIRISAEDIRRLGIEEGASVTVKRKVPLDEQIRKSAGETAEKIQTGAAETGKRLSETAEKIKEGTVETADKISEKAREIGEKVAGEVAPIGEKIGEAAQAGMRKIQGVLPINRFNADVESALKSLMPGDAEKVRGLLMEAAAPLAVIPVHSAAGRMLSDITIPPEADIIAVQRGDALTLSDTQVLAEGDLIYLSGPENVLVYMAEVLEG